MTAARRKRSTESERHDPAVQAKPASSAARAATASTATTKSRRGNGSAREAATSKKKTLPKPSQRITTDEPAVDVAGLTNDRPSGAGLYLHWDGRRSYRTHMPAPRVLEPVAELSTSDAASSMVIEGDNLQVMVSLRSQFRNGIDVAYLDPPYNTGRNDFRYSDKRFHDPNAEADDAVYVSSEDGGRHTKWLNYMGPRLYLVWELLADHGVCFVSISDDELYRLGMLMDEVFGEANKLGVLIWHGTRDNNPTRIATEHEYILCYAKRKAALPPIWSGGSVAKEWLMSQYTALEALHGHDLTTLQREFQAVIRAQVAQHKAYISKLEVDASEGDIEEVIDLGALARYRFVDERGPYSSDRHTDNPGGPGYYYDVRHPNGKVCAKPTNGYRFPPDRMTQLLAENRIVFGKDETKLVEVKRYLKDFGAPLRSVIDVPARAGANRLKKLFPDGETRFKHPKPVELIESLLSFAGNLDAVVLDPFAGSGTTGHAVMTLNAKDGGNRRFILIEEGTEEDKYCRTLTAARLAAAIERESLLGDYTFLETGQRLDRDAILALERAAIANLIVQTDLTGMGRGITPIAGQRYIIGRNSRGEGIALCWAGRHHATVTRQVLHEIFLEAKSIPVMKPLRIYGTTCTVGETQGFRFCQIPDEILAALQLAEEQAENEDQALVNGLESLETAIQRSGSST